jgi:hypothetical protein
MFNYFIYYLHIAVNIRNFDASQNAYPAKCMLAW